MKRFQTWQKLAFTVVLILAIGSCDPEPDVTYRQASKELVSLIEEGLAAGLKGKPPPPKPEVDQDICTNNELAPTGEVEPSYRYFFPIELLGPNPDAEGFMEAVGNVWKKRGIRFDRSDVPEILDGFGVGKGYNLEVFVNFENNMVKVGGNGPCTDPPAKASLNPDGP